MKCIATDVTIPKSIHEKAVSRACTLGMALNDLYVDALKAYFQENGHSNITEKLNSVYADESSTLDTDLAAMQTIALGRDQW